MQDNIFWTNDISILFKDTNYLKFVPYQLNTTTENLNALVRFSLYLLIFFLLMHADTYWLLLPLFVIVLTIIINYATNNQNIKLTESSEPFCELNKKFDVGYYDFDENLIFTNDENCKYKKKKLQCRRPTNDNPFMNPSIDDMNKEHPVSCNEDDEKISTEIHNAYNDDIYRDINDVFDRKNSQRQFFTVAHNIPNDQEGFARWCYNFPPNCKSNTCAQNICKLNTNSETNIC